MSTLTNGALNLPEKRRPSDLLVNKWLEGASRGGGDERSPAKQRPVTTAAFSGLPAQNQRLHDMHAAEVQQQ